VEVEGHLVVNERLVAVGSVGPFAVSPTPCGLAPWTVAYTKSCLRQPWRLRGGGLRLGKCFCDQARHLRDVRGAGGCPRSPGRLSILREAVQAALRCNPAGSAAEVPSGGQRGCAAVTRLFAGIA
jgi:hypothetical protein